MIFEYYADIDIRKLKNDPLRCVYHYAYHYACDQAMLWRQEVLQFNIKIYWLKW